MKCCVTKLLIFLVTVYAVNAQSITDLFNLFGGFLGNQNQISRSYQQRQPQINRQQYNPRIHGPVNQQHPIGNQNFQRSQPVSNRFDDSNSFIPIQRYSPGSTNSIANPSENSRNNVIGNNAYNTYANPNSVIQNNP